MTLEVMSLAVLACTLTHAYTTLAGDGALDGHGEDEVHQTSHASSPSLSEAEDDGHVSDAGGKTNKKANKGKTKQQQKSLSKQAKLDLIRETERITRGTSRTTSHRSIHAHGQMHTHIPLRRLLIQYQTIL